jgi:phosphatidylinositol kinase/protein kinase (PI-3  family)
MNAPGTAPDEFYQTVTINALVNVLADPTLTNNHWSATEAVMLIFTTQGLKCVPYLGQVCVLVCADISVPDLTTLRIRSYPLS